MKTKKYGFCFNLFDTPHEAARYAADVMTADEIEHGGLQVFETDTTMLLKDYLALPAAETRQIPPTPLCQRGVRSGGIFGGEV